MQNTNGATFEGYVQYVYRTLLNLRGENIRVSRRTTFVLGSGETYEIDVFYEFYKAGVKHRVAIECKDWQRPISQGEVLEFAKKIKNIGQDVVGVIITRNGFQEGALNAAKRDNILTLSSDDLPTMPELVGKQLISAALHEPDLIGEPFWVIAETSSSSDGLSTGVYYAVKMDDVGLAVPLFFSRLYAEAIRNSLPDKNQYAVFGLPQYKLRVLLKFLASDKHYAMVCLSNLDETRSNKIAGFLIDHVSLEKEYLLANE